MKNKNLISLDDVIDNPARASLGGGKFCGLVKIQKLLSEIRKKYQLNVQTPKTFAISTDAFDDYKLARNEVSEELVNLAMQAAAACGGNVAVRSSADIEDKGGKTHSGTFDTVLNVKTKAQMRRALQQVYSSARNVKNAKMGIVIQQMIPKPKLAGVIYSEAFDASQDIVIHYTKDKTAEDLIVGGIAGTFNVAHKYAFKSEEDFFNNEISPLSPDCFGSDNMFRGYNLCLELAKKGDETPDCLNKTPFEQLSLHQLNSIIPMLETSQKNPVDVEFAVAKGEDNMPVLYILQQRPYLNNPNYKVIFANNLVSGYKKDKGSIIEGEVCELDISKPLGCDLKFQENCAGKIILARASKKDDVGFYECYASHGDLFNRYYRSHLTDTIAILTTGSVQDVLYGHCGNHIHDDGYPFLAMKNKTAFDNIKNGDYIRLDLKTGQYQIKSRKNQRSTMPSRER